jgi:hypothetical protein
LAFFEADFPVLVIFFHHFLEQILPFPNASFKIVYDAGKPRRRWGS